MDSHRQETLDNDYDDADNGCRDTSDSKPCIKGCRKTCSSNLAKAEKIHGQNVQALSFEGAKDSEGDEGNNLNDK
ncbi:hypothetical protein J4E89_003051 [Alternaria sp. Ai002NY15]|nr:hypothetical protein J4E89_003051 [Alternaria sp. Ai002NY15]